MAKTIPQLTDATTVNAADELIIMQSGITKRATGAELAKGLNTINDTVNVKDFGAVGDGVADDTAAIQNALNSGAKQVYFPVGVYLVTSPLLVPSNIQIHGAGRNAIVQWGANITVLHRGVFSINGSSNVTICNLAIDGQRATYTNALNNGVDVNWTALSGGAAGNNVLIERVYIYNMGGAGIQCLASSVTVSSNITVSFCEITNIGTHGIIAQDFISDVYFCNNRVKNYNLADIVGGRVGITAARSGSRVIVANNWVECDPSILATSSHGISLDSTQEVTVTGNVVRNAVGFGIEIGGVQNGTFSNNSVSGGIRSGIASAGRFSAVAGVVYNKNIAVVGNVIRNQARGVYFGKEGGVLFQEDITIADNTVSDCLTLGIDVNCVDRLSVTGNTVAGCGLTGIYVLDCKNWIVSANCVVKNNIASLKDVSAITRVGSTATVSSASHGFNDGNVVRIFGANPSGYSDTFTISNVLPNSFDIPVVSNLTTPAVGSITCATANDLGHGGIRANYVDISERNTGVFGKNYTYQNGFRDTYDIGYNGFVGPVEDLLFLKETNRPRVENLTSGESANILDRAAIYVQDDHLVIAYNNAGTINFLSCALDGDSSLWASGTSVVSPLAKLKTATATLSAMSGATVTATSLIPAGSIVFGVTARVTTAITGATSFDIGDGTDADRWGDNIAIALATTTTAAAFTITSLPIYASTTSVVLTANGSNFTGGAVKLSVSYISLGAPAA